MMESGPVAGIIASARGWLRSRFPNIMAFDMGGTTTKASLIRDGEPTRVRTDTMSCGYWPAGIPSWNRSLMWSRSEQAEAALLGSMKSAP